MAKILDGKALSAKIKDSLKVEVADLKNRGIVPGLAVIIVGDDPASRVYVNGKKKDCEEIGIYAREYTLGEETTQEELLNIIDGLNHEDSISGILVQLPLPKHLDEKLVLNRIDPKKDVDAFHPVNVGKIMIGDYDFLPCTPAGVMEFFNEAKIDVAGKDCVVIGRSNIVGKPQAMLMLHKNATVTICHSKTADLKATCKRADILIAAIGRAKMINRDYVKEGAVVIDVGMNRDENGKLCGDVDFEDVCDLASYITPVPGGVGPMTRAMLMKNTVTAAKLN